MKIGYTRVSSTGQNLAKMKVKHEGPEPSLSSMRRSLTDRGLEREPLHTALDFMRERTFGRQIVAKRREIIAMAPDDEMLCLSFVVMFKSTNQNYALQLRLDTRC